MSRKSSTYQQLTRMELRDFFEPYRQAFPEWEIELDATLTRTQGPLRQCLCLERLQYAAYRPSHFIRILIDIPDGCSLLHQYLDAKHRQIERRQHITKWPQVIRAMEEQFVPSIRRPLDPAETLQLAERAAERDRIDSISYSTGLAVLNAYMGDMSRALHWCERVGKRAATIGSPLGDRELRKVTYVLELQRAIDSGAAQGFLEP